MMGVPQSVASRSPEPIPLRRIIDGSTGMSAQAPPNNPSQDTTSDEPAGNYHKLSRFMGRWAEMCIFRRFGALNAQNILFLQAELAHLEWELGKIRERDSTQGNDSEKKYSQSWWSVSRSVSDENSAQYKKILQIREKLDEYSKLPRLDDNSIHKVILRDDVDNAVLQYKDICGIHRPTKHNLQALRYYLESKEGGDCFLGALESDPWDERRQDLQTDLITLSEEHHQRDIFSAWVGDNLLTWYQMKFGHWGKREIRDIEGSMTYYGDSKIAAICRFFGALVASILPAISIFILFYVEDLLTRLGAILALSALFSFSLAIFTRATKREIFAATAAFASVQVVFVGQTGLHHQQFKQHISTISSFFT